MALKPEVLKGWPPGGWEFCQPQTNWHAPTPLVFTFEQQVRNIIAMRKQNTRFHLNMGFAEVAAELAYYTEKRLKSQKGSQKFIVGSDDSQKKTTSTSIMSLPGQLLRRAVEGVAGVVRVDPGALIEWFGQGKRPVDNHLSEHRASVCATCPANTSSPTCPEGQRTSWRDWITAAVAKDLARYMEIRHSMELSTSKDEQLGKCIACKCELKLKVHTPLDHIRANMKPEVAQELQKYPYCWVLNE